MIGAPWVGLSVVGTWFVVSMAVSSLLVWVATPWVLARAAGLAPARRANALVLWRLLPSAASLWVAGLAVAPTFLRHETGGSTEAVPGWMALLMVVAFLTVSVRGARSLRAVGAVRRHLRRVAPGCDTTGPAEIVETAAGTAFVAGLLEPRIVVSQTLASSLTAREFDAVVAHERAHIGARDNLKRLAMLLAPDWLGLTTRGRGVERAWAQAAELAADDAVAAGGARAAIDLAAALVKAARLSAAPSVRLELSSGMFDGDEITTRVTRLAAPGPGVADARRASPLRPAVAIAAALAAALLLQVSPASRTLHEVSEWAINRR